jgi:hypothetical protein
VSKELPARGPKQRIAVTEPGTSAGLASGNDLGSSLLQNADAFPKTLEHSRS